jgi:hypothetical protein
MHIIGRSATIREVVYVAWFECFKERKFFKWATSRKEIIHNGELFSSAITETGKVICHEC